MKPSLGLGLLIVLVVLVLVSLSTYTVDERESALVSQFGEIMRVVDEPGLHWKVPALQRVRYFDDRLLTLDTPETERFQTKEKKNLLVDSFVQWRIADVREYYTKIGEDEARATTQLGQLMNSALREEFGERTVQEVVSGKREEIMKAALDKAQIGASRLGIKIVDVRLKRVELPVDVTDAVYNRMNAERRAVASQLRSQGFSEAEKIKAEADRQREVIIANAYKKAQTTKGEGDARAAAIYGRAFSENPEFYSFYRSLDVYRQGFSSRSDVLVLDPNSDFFKYFKNPDRGAAAGR
ncbi:MAG TPA: protease modulator HflC [Burkholderiales bacterium]|nr:protease modulator HflC [Burkholderiales bacterium]